MDTDLPNSDLLSVLVFSASPRFEDEDSNHLLFYGNYERQFTNEDTTNHTTTRDRIRLSVTTNFLQTKISGNLRITSVVSAPCGEKKDFAGACNGASDDRLLKPSTMS